MKRDNKSGTNHAELRGLAEEIVRQKNSSCPENRDPLSLEESQRMFHELMVHQIELEMQNEELRHAQHELVAAQSRYFDLYDLAPVGYVTLSKDGLILESNLTFSSMLDIVRSRLVNHPLSSVILPADIHVWNHHRTQLLETDGLKVCEIRMLKKNSDPFWVRIKVNIKRNDDGEPLYRAVLTDISEQKQIEKIHFSRHYLVQFAVEHTLDEVLVETLNILESLTDSSIGFYHFFDDKTECVILSAWSTRTSKKFCHAEGMGNHYPIEQAGVWVDCVRENKAVIHNDYAALPHRKGLPEGHAMVTRELLVPVKRGGRIVAILGLGNKANEYGQEDINTVSLFADLAFDIAEKKKAEEALKTLNEKLELRVAERTAALYKALDQRKMVSVALLLAEERERERIAAELHDRVGQSLLLAKMKLDELADVSVGACRSSTEEITALLQSSIHDIRTLTFKIRPPILDTAGLDTSLKWLCSSLSDDYPIQIEFAGVCHAESLPADVRYSVYQAVRELLLNVVKHAASKKARVSLKADDGSLVILVEDEGIGFDQRDADVKNIANGGYGLYNLKLRIEQLNGSFSVTSTPGKGTSAKITVPLTEQDAGKDSTQ